MRKHLIYIGLVFLLMSGIALVGTAYAAACDNLVTHSAEPIWTHAGVYLVTDTPCTGGARTGRGEGRMGTGMQPH